MPNGCLVDITIIFNFHISKACLNLMWIVYGFICFDKKSFKIA